MGFCLDKYVREKLPSVEELCFSSVMRNNGVNPY